MNVLDKKRDALPSSTLLSPVERIGVNKHSKRRLNEAATRSL
jgi:hypothetical protein